MNKHSLLYYNNMLHFSFKGGSLLYFFILEYSLLAHDEYLFYKMNCNVNITLNECNN